MEIQKRNDVTVIVMDDRFDAAVAQKLKDVVRNIAEQDRIKLVMDLAKTRFIDSSGCGALVASLRAVIKNNGDMKIASPSAQARSLFQLTRLNKVFEIYDDVEAALKSFSQNV
ncbi:MAG: STAS domain-containing protein [Desulfomonile sp.]|jgi:anti-sigma B factor antagonist|nr:STAS domain-containing protein [Deltaproteobacteria bacterium]